MFSVGEYAMFQIKTYIEGIDFFILQTFKRLFKSVAVLCRIPMLILTQTQKMIVRRFFSISCKGPTLLAFSVTYMKREFYLEKGRVVMWCWSHLDWRSALFAYSYIYRLYCIVYRQVHTYKIPFSFGIWINDIICSHKIWSL